MTRIPTQDQCWSRRTALASIGTATVIGLAGCQGRRQATKSQLQKQLDTVRTETQKYKDPKKAVEDGFKITGPYVPGMGWHFMHPKRVKSAANEGMQRTKPQILTYNKEMQLGAVEWGVPKQAVDGSLDLFADENADATETWHPHETATHVFAKPDGKQTSPKQVSFADWTTNDNWAEFRPPDENLSPGDEIALNWGSPKANEGEKETRIVDVASTHPDLTTLHVWVHTENPEGVFNPINPKWGGEGH